jgi:hypothetical protein
MATRPAPAKKTPMKKVPVGNAATKKAAAAKKPASSAPKPKAVGTAAKLGVQAPEGIFASFFGREWTRGLDFEIGEDRRRGRGACC